MPKEEMSYDFNPKLFEEKKQLKISRINEQIKHLRKKQVILQKQQIYLQETKARLVDIKKGEMPVLDINSMQNNESLTDNEFLALDNDPDVLNCLAMDEDEFLFKKQIWEAENYDWIQWQKDKNQLATRNFGEGSESVELEIQTGGLMSKKINYNILKK